MKDFSLKLEYRFNNIKSIIYDINNNFSDALKSNNFSHEFIGFENSVTSYKSFIESNEIESALQQAMHIAMYAKSISKFVTESTGADDSLKDLGSRLLDETFSFSKIIEDISNDYNDLKDKGYSFLDLNNFQFGRESLKKIIHDLNEYNEVIQKQLANNETRLENIEVFYKDLSAKVKKELDEFSILYNKEFQEIKDKKDKIDQLLGHVSNKVIAGDFGESAKEEKTVANVLRYASLACMALIVLVVAYSFWETIQPDFNWQKSIFRLVLAFMLSIPAAYLARESAKHREKQYAHQQTSLDLKAIAPYIASLPQEEQHKIKIEIAGRIFAAKDFNKVDTDSYPININEIIMEIIKKLDIKKS